MREIYPNIFSVKKRLLATKNQLQGIAVYGEKLIKQDGAEFRLFDPHNSKLAAGIIKGVDPGLKKNASVLYLGASTGTTVSHVSDIVEKGIVFAIDSAPRVVRDLLFLAMERKNIAPILADAHQPATYAHRISKVDWLYQDIAAKDQVGIFLKNIDAFMEKNGTAILCLKARSVDISKKSAVIIQQTEDHLSKKLKILKKLTLEPYYKDHCMFVCTHQ